MLRQESDWRVIRIERTRETRGNPYQLKTKKPRLAIRKNFFAVAAVADWNSLPEKVVRCDNVNAFKRSLDRHWEHKMFNTEFLVRNGLTWKSWSTEAVAYRSEKNLWTCEQEVHWSPLPKVKGQFNWVEQVLWIMDSVLYVMDRNKRGTGFHVKNVLTGFTLSVWKYQRKYSFTYPRLKFSLIFAIRVLAKSEPLMTQLKMLN